MRKDLAKKVKMIITTSLILEQCIILNNDETQIFKGIFMPETQTLYLVIRSWNPLNIGHLKVVILLEH